MPLVVPKVGKLAGKLNLCFEQGADFPAQFVWWGVYYKEGDSRNVAADLTGHTARMQIRKTVQSGILFEATTENGLLTLGGAAGTITLAIPNATTEGFSWKGKAYWDLELVDPATMVFRLLEGRAEISREITR